MGVAVFASLGGKVIMGSNVRQKRGEWLCLTYDAWELGRLGEREREQKTVVSDRSVDIAKGCSSIQCSAFFFQPPVEISVVLSELGKVVTGVLHFFSSSLR